MRSKHFPILAYPGEALTLILCFFALAVGSAILLLIGGYILREAAPVLFENNNILPFLTSAPWAPFADPPTFGILHAWTSTLMMVSICMGLAIPVGFCSGIFFSEIGSEKVRSIGQPCLDLLAGIPAVVYGFVGYVTLVPWFENHFQMATGESLLVAAIVLAIMILPFVASTSSEACRMVPKDIREAAYSQGVTRWHVIRRIIVPQSASGLFAAVALGLARAIGETLAVMMLAGNSVSIPHSVLDRGQPLTALIATELGESGVGSDKYHSLFGAASILIVIIVAINGLIWFWKIRIMRRG